MLASLTGCGVSTSKGCRTHQRHTVAHRFEAALRLLDEPCRVYQYLVKRIVAPFVPSPCSAARSPDEAIAARVAYPQRADVPSCTSSHCISSSSTKRHTSPARSTSLRGLWSHLAEAMRAWLSTDATFSVLEAELDRAVATLQHKASAFEVQLKDFGLDRLPKAEAFRFLRQLVNYDPHVAAAGRLRYDTHLDYFVSDSAVECHRDHLRIRSSAREGAVR